MSSHQPLPLRDKPELEMSFSLGETQFQLAPGFSKAVQCLAFPTATAELPHSHMGFFSSMFGPSPGGGETFSPRIWPPVLSTEGEISSLAVLGYMDRSQTM
jgi:hypothetical protein